MCLAVPGRLIETFEEHEMPMGRVDFNGVVRKVCLLHVPDVEVGQYVLVHVGFALSKINEEEAARSFALLRELDQVMQADEEQAPTGEGV